MQALAIISVHFTLSEYHFTYLNMEYSLISVTPQLLPLGITEYISSFMDVTKYELTQDLFLKHTQLPKMRMLWNIGQLNQYSD
jgi:hypothetical protein